MCIVTLLLFWLMFYMKVCFFNRFIPESARWLLTKGRDLEADHILRKAAKVNKVELPEKLFDEETFESEKCVPVWKIFISFRLMMRTLIIFLNWLVFCILR